ncbi:MAG TPA: c-type cytochrome [Candidatus Binataceae bacterium]|nr:c-type cytochrome [Candidatus Binataceae bacterium]
MNTITVRTAAAIVLVYCFVAAGAAFAGEPLGKQEFLSNCSKCHGTDGKGSVPAMREAKGYRAVDLTQLSKDNGGRFPREEVHETIDGRKRYPAHFPGSMPAWGKRYSNQLGAENGTKVQKKISALVDYIESIQAK